MPNNIFLEQMLYVCTQPLSSLVVHNITVNIYLLYILIIIIIHCSSLAVHVNAPKLAYIWEQVGFAPGFLEE